MADSGDEFSGMMKSMGNDLLNLIKTIQQERQRRDREAKAEMAAAAKERRAEEMAEKHRMEDREFMKGENEKMREEMRSILKANGMEVSDKNLEMSQKHAEKMLSNEQNIEANEASIRSLDKRIDELNKEIDGHLNPTPDANGIAPPTDVEAVGKLRDEVSNLQDRRAGLVATNKQFEAENVMLKNGQGLEGLQSDVSVKMDLVKQVEQVNEGISRTGKSLTDVNDKIAKNEEASKKALNPPDGSVPNMKEWERLGAEKQDLLKQKEGFQKDLSEKQAQLKGLKEGKSLEQLQKAAKLDGEVNLAKEKVQGIDNVINGYKKNEAAIIDKHKEILKSPGGKLQESDYKELSDVRSKIKSFEAEKETAQKEVAKLEKDAHDLRNAPPQVEGPKVEGPKMEGAGKQVQGHGGGIPSHGAEPITELDTASKLTTTPQALEQTAPLTLEVDGLKEKVEGPKVGAKEEPIGPQVGKEKPDLSKYKISSEDSAKFGETPKDVSLKGTSLSGKSKDDLGVGKKKTVLQEMDSRGETPEFVRRKRGMSMSEGPGHKKGVGMR
ncbi:MAG: hypothetical protein ACAH88_19605 [Roseimicrobium sp.]